mmetsp:Transcript_23037/g.20925  ORF Transcript_23037/g.20925 Transcript_23037/m.20925 type:complete len:184 (+) Transcript_23037:163-714(+)
MNSPLVNKKSEIEIITTSVLSLLIRCTADNDPSTKKFACFAVGNAAFHSDELYPLLKNSIKPLYQALDDHDNKTRANAAGAISNLVRNNSNLSIHVSSIKIPEKLIHIVLYDNDIQLQRICLFGLGTMSVYQSCRDSILNYKIKSNKTNEQMTIIDVFKLIKEKYSNDSIILQYLQRLKNDMI